MISTVQARVLELAVSKLLDYRARPNAVGRAISLKRSPRPASPSRDRLTVAAVQMEFNLVENGVGYAEKIYGLARHAAESGAQLIAFPEYAWTPLAGMLPGIRGLSEKAGLSLDGAAAEASGGASLREIFLLLAPAVERAFLATGAAVALALGIYLMSGSTIARDRQGRLFNVGYLFGPGGEKIGQQKKLHPDPASWEREGMATGASLQAFQLPFASVAFPICMDFTYWETTRLASRQGIELLINPAADSAGDQEFLAARGVRTRVQESPAYGIAPRIVTDLFGLHWRGPSQIVAPLGLDPRGSILAQASTCDREEIITAELDLAALRAFRAAKRTDSNHSLQDKWLPAAYESFRARVARDGKRIVKEIT